MKAKNGRLLRPRESVCHYGILVNGRKDKFCESVSNPISKIAFRFIRVIR